MNGDLLDIVWEHDELADMDPPERLLALRELLAGRVGPGLNDAVLAVADAIDGYGPLNAVMADESVTDVLVNGPGEVWVERAGRLERIAVSFAGEDDLRCLVDRLAARAGARIDASMPVADACLPDGSRLHAVLPPVSPHGTVLSVRRWPRQRFTLDDLVERKMLDRASALRLSALVAQRRSLVISGATGTGKTTLLNALLEHVGDGERVVVIEETPELVPACAHVVSLVARAPNVEGRGGIDMRALVRAALRMRPDRIVVGEVRGAEALDALLALSTGHGGSLLTVHARSADDVLNRLTSLALLANSGSSEASLARQFRHAFDAIVHLERAGSARRIAAVADIG